MQVAPAPPEDCDPLVVARLSEFFDRRTPWPRSLWHVSTGLLLREVAEQARMLQTGAVANDTGYQIIRKATKAQVQADLAVPTALGDECRSALGTSPKDDPAASLHLAHLAERVDDGYLTRWSDRIGEVGLDSFERAARSIAAFLLDRGLSADHLFRWFQEQTDEDGHADLQDLVTGAATLLDAEPTEFRVLVPCQRLPAQVQDAKDLKRISKEAVPVWATDNEIEQTAIAAPAGAIEVTVSARDEFSAIAMARDVARRIRARTTLALETDRLVEEGSAFVAGLDKRFDLDESRRRVRVHAIRSRNQFVVRPSDHSSTLDDALELLVELETGTRGAAVSNGWAALEGVLSPPGDKAGHLAADRMADIVACSFPAAELRAIAKKHAEDGTDALAAQLSGEASGTIRATLVEGAIRDGQITGSSPGEKAAIARMAQIANDPEPLRRVRGYLRQAFHRLYRQRNILMHEGSFRAEALDATLRTVPALVGAGMDRLVYAMFDPDHARSPLALAAQAEVELKLVGTDAGRALTDLLA